MHNDARPGIHFLSASCGCQVVAERHCLPRISIGRAAFRRGLRLGLARCGRSHTDTRFSPRKRTKRSWEPGLAGHGHRVKTLPKRRSEGRFYLTEKRRRAEAANPRSQEAKKLTSHSHSTHVTKKPRSREAEKPRSQEAEKPRSREAAKPRSREAGSQEAAKPTSWEAEKPTSWEAEKPTSWEAEKLGSREAGSH